MVVEGKGSTPGAETEGGITSSYAMNDGGGAPSPKRRLLAALFGVKQARVPVGNVVSIATTGLMDACGAAYPEAHTNARAMTELAAAGYEILGFDTVMPVFSVTQEAAALGCEVDWGTRSAVPTVRTHPFAISEELALPGGWFEQDSIQVVLEAIGMLRRAYGHRVVVVGKAMGPWTLSYLMTGTEEFLVRTVVDPDGARRSLDVLKDVTISFANAQFQAGADVVCIADHATGGMVSPLVYRDMLMPVHKQIVQEVAGPLVLHCCGNTTDRINYFAQAGFDCYHFESQVDIALAREAAGSSMTLMGNINNPQLLLSETPKAVFEAGRCAAAAGVDILSPECAVPLGTPTENLRALIEAAESIDYDDNKRRN